MTELAGTHDYIYDQLNQLISATHPQPINPTEGFSYDLVGNRIGSAYTYNAGNQLLEDADYIYSYNKDGNTISKTNKSTGEYTRFTYNAIREITDIKKYASELDSTPIMSAHYIYDGLRRRILKDVDGTVTRYVYDNEDIILELDGAGTQLAHYTHGQGIDEPISMVRNANTYYYVTDALGSIIKVVDTSGNMVNEYVYDSFGNMVSKTEGVTNYYTYTGREWDAESSLYYYRIRYYDPGTGRFLNQDPMGFSQGPNFYTYTGNNPTLFTDSFGLWYGGWWDLYGFTGHQELTYSAAIGAGWNEDDATAMAIATAMIDVERSDLNDSGNNPWHYYVDTEQASRDLIRDLFGQAVKATNRNDAILYLGQSLHVLQDKWSHFKKDVHSYQEGDLDEHILDYDRARGAEWKKAQEQSSTYLILFNLSQSVGKVVRAFNLRVFK